MPLNIKQRKSRLREKHKKFRAELNSGLKKLYDKKITERFLALDEYKTCKRLFTYVSTGIEVDTAAIITRALAEGKAVFVPKCVDKHGTMNFYRINSFDDLKEGFYGILEPNEKKCEISDDLSGGLCIAPGLCFDLNGYRIGFGKGYYDRLLENFGGVAVGLCYFESVEKELAREIFDKPVDILVTEKYTNRISGAMPKE